MRLNAMVALMKGSLGLAAAGGGDLTLLWGALIALSFLIFLTIPIGFWFRHLRDPNPKVRGRSLRDRDAEGVESSRGSEGRPGPSRRRAEQRRHSGGRGNMFNEVHYHHYYGSDHHSGSSDRYDSGGGGDGGGD